MNKDQEMFYADQRGFATNIHPINALLSEENKIDFLCEVETVLQSVRNNHENVAKGFHRIIKLINSPN
ncbi:MAG: hypothetical protein AAF843_07770 [Bacteroidota bacterium]